MLRTVDVVTRLHQLRDDQEVSREDVADLYRQRWHAELNLRSLKSTMALDVLRCQTPEMVRTELWMGLLAYNLVCHSLAANGCVRRNRRSVAPPIEALCAGILLGHRLVD